MYVKTTGDQIAQFPYSLAEIRRDNPGTSFPRQIPDVLAAEFGVFPVTVAPMPDHASAQVAERDAEPTLTGGAWVLDWTVRDMTAEELTAARATKLAQLAEYRGETETGGITLPDGTPMPSDEGTARKLTSAVTSLQSGMVTAPIAWKFPGGWQDLTQAKIEGAAAAVAQHVQACFSAERAVHDQIAALPDVDVPGFDVQAAFDVALRGGGS